MKDKQGINKTSKLHSIFNKHSYAFSTAIGSTALLGLGGVLVASGVSLTTAIPCTVSAIASYAVLRAVKHKKTNDDISPN